MLAHKSPQATPTFLRTLLPYCPCATYKVTKAKGEDPLQLVNYLVQATKAKNRTLRQKRRDIDNLRRHIDQVVEKKDALASQNKRQREAINLMRRVQQARDGVYQKSGLNGVSLIPPTRTQV